jgi:hypothetical protein
MKPWEEPWKNEEWEADSDDLYVKGTEPDGSDWIKISEWWWAKNRDPWQTRLRLAAAAPEMARLLLELQWSGDEARYRCPACEATAHPDHAPDCRLVAVLRKAGWKPYRGEMDCGDCMTMSHCETHHKDACTYPFDDPDPVVDAALKSREEP